MTPPTGSGGASNGDPPCRGEMTAMKTQILVGLATLAVSGAAMAQIGTGGTITNGASSFTLEAYLGDGDGIGPGADLQVGGMGNPDHLSQAWWWFRLDSDTRETAFHDATSATFSQNIARIEYQFPTFNATMGFRISGVSDGFGFLTQQMTILNTSDQTITINLFNYADLDMAGTADDDVTSQSAPNVLHVVDGGGTGWRAHYEGTNRFTAQSFPTVRNLLTNNSTSNFTGDIGSAGPDNFTGAFQWTLTLSPFEAATVSSTITIVPAPGAAALAALGLLAALRRRR